MLQEFTPANILARFNRIRTEVVTKLNAIGALLALYALSNPSINESVLGFLPSDFQKIATVLLPLLWFMLVQKGKEIDKAKTVAVTEEKVIDKMVAEELNG